MLYCTLELMPWLEAAWAGRVLPISEVLECLGGTRSLVTSEWSCMDTPRRIRWEKILCSLVQRDPDHDYPDEIVLRPTILGHVWMEHINNMPVPAEENPHDAVL